MIALVRALQRDAAPGFRFVTEMIRPGDPERFLTEWGSLMRQISGAPDYPWDRWRGFQQAARAVEHPPPASVGAAFPPLWAAQRRPWQSRTFLVGGK